MVYRSFLLALLVASLGCTASSTPTTDDAVNADTPGTAVENLEEPASEMTDGGDAVALTPENTRIGFVGLHVVEEKPDPNPRAGHFQKFSGTATVADNQLTAIHVEIETDSITTPEEKLTAHLKNADFFDVLEYPQATFKSTSITPSENGQVTITGDLTMLKETKSITFPATVSTDGGLKLDAEFTIDRSEFGMTFGVDKVEKDVTLTITVGA